MLNWQFMFCEFVHAQRKNSRNFSTITLTMVIYIYCQNFKAILQNKILKCMQIRFWIPFFIKLLTRALTHLSTVPGTSHIQFIYNTHIYTIHIQYNNTHTIHIQFMDNSYTFTIHTQFIYNAQFMYSSYTTQQFTYDLHTIHRQFIYIYNQYIVHIQYTIHKEFINKTKIIYNSYTIYIQFMYNS